MVGNPFVSSLDYNRFCAVNSGVVESYYRVYSNGAFQTCTASDDDTIEVLQAFFVKPIGVAGTEVEILFTKDMSITRNGAAMELK
ncbi:MAG: hypothetical protein LBR67_04060, partial [Dysgonamonadaceae bacterium]|jgi:hypothetical protein|nr:hypothetical protein [Dysgonamonadaceae bacterium]